VRHFGVSDSEVDQSFHKISAEFHQLYVRQDVDGVRQVASYNFLPTTAVEF